MSLLAQRAQAWLAKNERAESLIVIGAWAGAYYGVHRLARAISNVAVPPSKDGAPGFLDAPQPKYSGCTLRIMFTPGHANDHVCVCLLYTSPSPRDATLSRMPSSA